MSKPTLYSLSISVYCNTYFYEVVHNIPSYYVQIQYYYTDTIFWNKHGWFYTSFNKTIILWRQKCIKFILKHHSIYYFQGREISSYNDKYNASNSFHKVYERV